MQLQGHPSRWGSGRAAAAAAATRPTPPAMTQRPVLPPAARRIITAQVSFDPWLRKGSPVSIACMTFQKSDCAGHTGGRAGARPRQRARKQPDAWTSWNTRVSEAIAVRLHRHLAWFLTVHIPGGFDRFTLAVGTPATGTTTMPPQEVRPDPAALAAIASSFGIEILGPPLTP
jgi:hypothetical protein